MAYFLGQMRFRDLLVRIMSEYFGTLGCVLNLPVNFGMDDRRPYIPFPCVCDRGASTRRFYALL